MNVFNPPGKSLRAFFLPTKIQQCSKLKFSMSLWKIIETKWTTWETPPEAPVIVGQNIRNSENKTHNPFINPPSTIFSQNIRKLQKIKAFPVLIPGCNFLFPGKGDGKLIVGFPNFRMGTGMNIFSVFCSNCICDCVLCVSPSSGMNRQHRHFTVFLKPMEVCVFHCVSMIQGAGTLFLHLFALQQQWLLALVAVKEQHARRLSTSCTSVRGEGNLSTPLFAKPKIWAPQCGVHIPQQLATLTRCRPISQSMRMHTHPGSRCHLWRNNLQADFMTFNFLFAYFSFPDQC